jgi:hypothetical protein
MSLSLSLDVATESLLCLGSSVAVLLHQSKHLYSVILVISDAVLCYMESFLAILCNPSDPHKHRWSALMALALRVCSLLIHINAGGVN